MGMHSYELSFEDWFVPEANLVVARRTRKRFYCRCRGSKTPAPDGGTGLGLMQAAYEAAAPTPPIATYSGRRSATTSYQPSWPNGGDHRGTRNPRTTWRLMAKVTVRWRLR